jgi:hypothetical protein
MNRRSFLEKLAVLGGVILWGCGKTSYSNNPYGSTSTPPQGGNCSVNGTTVSIQVVHTPNHTLTIPLADVNAGITQTYTLADNGAGHTHTVTITAADFSNLRQNQGIVEVSSSVGHTHSVTVGCA